MQSSSSDDETGLYEDLSVLFGCCLVHEYIIRRGLKEVFHFFLLTGGIIRELKACVKAI